LPRERPFGSLADVEAYPSDVRFSPERRHVQCTRLCPLWANSGTFANNVLKVVISRVLQCWLSLQTVEDDRVNAITAGHRIFCWRANICEYAITQVAKSDLVSSRPNLVPTHIDVVNDLLLVHGKGPGVCKHAVVERDFLLVCWDEISRSLPIPLENKNHYATIR
jgi:hypothetical protein